MGAVVYFARVVRGSEEQQPITALDYEAFEPMARRQFELIFQEIEKYCPSSQSAWCIGLAWST